GFAEDMEELEDWNLWTRYTLVDDFAYAEKTTSIYRVPADLQAAAERKTRLDTAYLGALARQADLPITLTPRQIAYLGYPYARTQLVRILKSRGLALPGPEQMEAPTIATGEVTLVRGQRFVDAR